MIDLSKSRYYLVTAFLRVELSLLRMDYMERDETFRRLLTTILVAGVPEPAARLKQRLAAACKEQGLPPFDHKTAGYKRFKDYLLRHSDLIALSESVGGDMVVSLREGASGSTTSAAVAPPIAIRGDVWLAFANPDEHRLRYLDRTSGRVIHFPAGAPEQAKASEDKNLIQILPASGATQSAWMKDFLGQTSSAELSELPLSSFVETEYRSSINAAFTRALGRHAGDWRAYRTARMVEYIKTWADQTSIPLSSLKANADPRGEAGGTEGQPSRGMSVRERAIRLIEGLTDEELHCTAIPILLATLMVKSQKS